MKAILSDKPGGPDSLVLSELPTPKPAAGELRINVKSVGVNYPDLLIIEDKYQFKPQRPFSPGAEFAGVVDALGEGVTDFVEGDRVMALPYWGGMAEQVCES